VLLALDGIGTAAALWFALWLRLDGSVPPYYLAAVPRALAVLIAARLAANWAAGLHRWSFRLSGLQEALRVAMAAVGGSIVFYAVYGWIAPHGLPRTVYVLEFFGSTSFFGALRFGPRAVFRWLHELRAREDAERMLVIGQGYAAELLARDIHRSPDARQVLVGLVGDKRGSVGQRIDGARVVGTVSELPDLIRRHRVSTVLLADQGRDSSRLRAIVETCSDCNVRFKIVPPSLEQSERLSVTMLQELSPEDLLPRDSVAFDEAASRTLIEGRRALVTGAGGTIGGELCRQLLRFGVRQLVMVDINENELYLGGRRLAAQFPDADIRLEVADIREAAPLRKLGERYRPQDVLHAAAHKHVPLIESSPDEAVKNNVFGTLHAAQMAHLCGAERFVLVSTDKAVKPTSVMGATKRVAELIVRDIGRTSRTKMTAIRFGNVLGSAGSVLPIFKEQIARGGPVTVTHAECTRYFMTVSEAAGLTLLAGLGGYGDLCVLDMGEPFRIAQLARSMIALAGRSGEIEIVYTGLRPGEKLHEEVLTEEEERSQIVRNRIRVTHSPAPPSDLATWLVQLRRLADAGDRARILSVLHALVPTYRPTRNVANAEGLLRTPASQRRANVAAVVARSTNGSGRASQAPAPVEE
jgi:FlaA1/EpsC-like NDP-sugar epimerase